MCISGLESDEDFKEGSESTQLKREEHIALLILIPADFYERKLISLKRKGNIYAFKLQKQPAREETQ